MPNHLRTTKAATEHEQLRWSLVFGRELGKKRRLYSSYWWETYFNEIRSVVLPIINGFDSPKILEVGCGSGKASIVLGEKLDRTLMDISIDAIVYARELAKTFRAKNIVFDQGDIFQMPYREMSFNFVWNIGTVEHYKKTQAKQMTRSMIKVLQRNGYLAIGVPNFKSPPLIKARLLNKRIFKAIPGYRTDSENDYSQTDIINFVKSAARSCGRAVDDIRVYYLGAPLFVESPKLVVKTIGRILEKTMPQRKFLIFVVCRVD